MAQLLLWLNIHRQLVIILLAIVLWVGAYAAYVRPIVENIVKSRRPHNWQVDLASKKAVSRGKTQV